VPKGIEIIPVGSLREAVGMGVVKGKVKSRDSED